MTSASFQDFKLIGPRQVFSMGIQCGLDVFASARRLRFQGVWPPSSFVQPADGRPLFFWLLLTALWLGDLCATQ